MKKRLYILFLSLFSVSGVTSAQEVFNKVMESAQHILNEPTSTFTNTQIAKFKVDELNYMKGKAMEKDSVAAIDLLDTEIIYSTDLSAEDRKAKILLFIQASCACPLFNDTDKEKINKYIDGDAQLTPFCLDTDWYKAYQFVTKAME